MLEPVRFDKLESRHLLQAHFLIVLVLPLLILKRLLRWQVNLVKLARDTSKDILGVTVG